MSFHRILLTGICIITATTAWADGAQTPTHKQQQWNALDTDPLKRNGERYEHKNKSHCVAANNKYPVPCVEDDNQILYDLMLEKYADYPLLRPLIQKVGPSGIRRSLVEERRDGSFLTGYSHFKPQYTNQELDEMIKGEKAGYLRVGYRDGSYGCVSRFLNDVAALQARILSDSIDAKDYIWSTDPARGPISAIEDRKIPPCLDDDFRSLENDSNAESYIYDSIIDPDNVAEVVIRPKNACLTYRCKDGYRANLDLKNRYHKLSGIKPQCLSKLDACTIYNGTKVTDKLVAGEKQSGECTSPNYIKKGSAKSLGEAYIEDLKTRMEDQLKDNLDLARDVSAKSNSSFTCDDNKCTLNGNPFSSNNCDFLCGGVDDGFLVRLSGDNPCPAYFKYEYDAKQDMWVCNFDAAAIQGAKETAAKKAKDACQNALCKATGGTMNESGACMCGEDECNNKYTDSNGNTYNYCGIKGEQPKAYCNGTQYIKITNRTQEDTANNNKFYQKLNNNGIDSIFEEACPTSNAMSDVTGSKTDIPTLVANLSKIESEFGLSKWRTAEGKFNYARLASDATAGIVLGTTGALVTAHVVKKKQVEDGFESLECTVGGQHVGDWGDVFRIDGK